jgi:Poly(hydroxyalcanoate) granule associated protein (phasin)
MLKATAGNFNVVRMTDAALLASRQVWLAGIGAATVTRQWAAKDAGPMFRSLVKEGEVVEGRARRVIDRQLGNSIALATAAWNTARDTARTTVNGFLDAATAALPKLLTPAKASAPKTIRRSPAKSRKTRKIRRARKG